MAQTLCELMKKGGSASLPPITAGKGILWTYDGVVSVKSLPSVSVPNAYGCFLANIKNYTSVVANNTISGCMFNTENDAVNVSINSSGTNISGYEYILLFTNATRTLTFS